MGVFAVPIIEVLKYILWIYGWLIVLQVVFSWLIAFNIVNTYNRTVAMVLDFLYRVTEPVMRPLRRLIPVMGGLDITPMIVLLIIYLIYGELSAIEYRLYVG